VTALLDPAAKCQVAPGAILVASWCALAAVVDLVAARAWAMVQADSVESINRHEVLPDWACTARLDRIRNIDMCTQNNLQIGESSQERNLPCTLVEEIIVAPQPMQHMASAIMLIVLLAADRDTQTLCFRWRR
jgi:hypothetical protein